LEFSVGSIPRRTVRPLPVRRRVHASERPVIRSRLLAEVFDVCPAGILVVSAAGKLVTWNPAVVDLLGDFTERATTCCEVFGCRSPGTGLAGICLTEQALARSKGPIHETVVEPPANPGARVAIRSTAFTDATGPTVVFELQEARTHEVVDVGESAAEPTLRIRTLGETIVETPSGEIRDGWLDQRAGRLLKFLVVYRYMPMHADAIAEALWPRARTDTTNTVRHFVHALREKLEPARTRYQQSAFVLARNGGYVLNRERVTVDADEFEAEAKGGLIAHAANDKREAAALLGHAVELYGGDFLPDERFEDWAIAERERLRDLASRALRQLADRTDDPAVAAGYLERLADMEPLDVDIHRDLIGTWLRQGRRGRAMRHYRALQSRLMRELGEPVSFDLGQLARTGSSAE
jgi:DNA-binding SARP family transcriptional activator